MTDPQLEPLDPVAHELLHGQGAPEVLSAARREQLFRRVEASVAGAASAGVPAAAPQATASVGAAKLGAIIVASVITGAVGSRVVEHRFFPQPPVVIERVIVKTEPAPVAPVPEPVVAPSEPPAPPKTATKITRPLPPRSTPVTISSRERQLIEVARTALLKADSAEALKALSDHRSEFAAGQLAEERDSLEVQALMQAGRVGEARAAAQRFKRQYPESILGPAVDAFVE